MTGHASPAAGKPPVRRRGLRRRLADNLNAILVIGALKLILHLPERPVWAVADFAGGISYRLSPARRA